MRALLQASLAGVLLAASMGCYTVHAKAPAPLTVPEPPSKVVLPPAPLPVEPPPVVTQSPTTPVPTSSTTTPPPPPNSSTLPANRPATPPPATPPPNPETSPTLQTTVNTQEIARRIQTQLDSAKRDLSRVDRRTLSKDELENYDWAYRMYREAEEKVKAKDFNNADQLSNKAARLASLLAKGSTSPTWP